MGTIGAAGEDVPPRCGAEKRDPPAMSEAEFRELLRNPRLRSQRQRLIAEESPAPAATAAGNTDGVVVDLPEPPRTAAVAEVREENLVDYEGEDDA